MFRIAVFFYLTTFITCVYSQQQPELTGRVISSEGSPVEAASVVLQGTPYKTTTDADGLYRLTPASGGSYTILVSYLGYQSAEITVQLALGSPLRQDITLMVDSKTLQEVAIFGKNAVDRVRDQPYNVTAIDAKKLHNSSSDLNQVLNRATGIRVRESGGIGSSFNFSINGFSGDQVKFFLDGVPIDNYGSSFTLNNLPTNLAERIDVYKGVVPIELGADALGGAVNIVTNQTVSRYLDASYSVGSFNTHKLSLNTRTTSKQGWVTNFNAFGNYADNSYGVDVSVADKQTGAFGPVQRYPHFHDGYKQAAILVETGVKGKSYADYLLLGAMIMGNQKEVQQGSTMQRVVGDAFTDSKGFAPSLKFRKSGLFDDRLTVDAAATFNVVESRSVDTSSARYNWAGESYVDNYQSGGEINSEKTIYVYNEHSLQSNANLQYRLSDHHRLAVNHAYMSYTRKAHDAFRDIRDPGTSVLDKHILGLSYQLSALNDRLSVTAFGKQYYLRTKLVTADAAPGAENDWNYGYGAAAAYDIWEDIQLKASFEHAYRLPSPLELLGDGLLIQASKDLKPENSDNFNAGLSVKRILSDHFFWIQGNFIYRNARDFIRIRPSGVVSSYENLANIRVTGFDALVHYAYRDWLTVDLNVTNQRSKNTNRFDPPWSDIPDYKYGALLPNTPILFGNADVGLVFRKVGAPDATLNALVGSSYIDSYYLGWPVLGDPRYKRAIPEQLTHHVQLTYSLAAGKYNIALECRNITDVKVYDYFNVQKPGRSFTMKLRYFLTR